MVIILPINFFYTMAIPKQAYRESGNPLEDMSSASYRFLETLKANDIDDFVSMKRIGHRWLDLGTEGQSE